MKLSVRRTFPRSAYVHPVCGVYIGITERRPGVILSGAVGSVLGFRVEVRRTPPSPLDVLDAALRPALTPAWNALVRRLVPTDPESSC